MTHQSTVVHSTFSIERTYPTSAARVFAAFSNPSTKRRWFAEGEGWEVHEFTVDFRVGGLETSRFRFKGGEEIRNDTVYQDIVPDQRIVIAYSMTVGGKRISASLATMEMVPVGYGTRLTYTEQGAFFDGLSDGPEGRKQGCTALLKTLADELQRSQ